MDRLDELSLLIAILDGGTLAAAARRTRRSPAAATRMLGSLEARLGVRLVERTTRRMAPTDAGRRLAEHGRRLLADYGEAVDAAAADRAEPRGLLRVSAPLVFGRRHIAPIVTAFLDAHPRIEVELMLSNRAVDLVEQEVDVALRIGHLADSSAVARRVGQVRHLIVASPDYLARRGRPRSLEAIAAHEAVLQSADGQRPDWQFAVAGRGSVTVRPQARLIVNQAETAIQAALAGRGLIRALSYQVAAEIASGALVRLLRRFEPPPLPVNLMFTSARLMALRVRAFVDFAAAALARLDVLRGR